MNERTEETKSYYCARAKLSRNCGQFGKKGDWVAFGWSYDHHFPQLDVHRDRVPMRGGKRWEQPPTQAELSWWQGMPCDLRFDPATVEIIHVVEVHKVDAVVLTDPIVEKREGENFSKRVA